MQRLCVSDLDRRKIKKMDLELTNIIDSKNDLSVKNTSLKVFKLLLF